MAISAPLPSPSSCSPSHWAPWYYLINVYNGQNLFLKGDFEREREGGGMQPLYQCFVTSLHKIGVKCEMVKQLGVSCQSHQWDVLHNSWESFYPFCKVYLLLSTPLRCCNAWLIHLCELLSIFRRWYKILITNAITRSSDARGKVQVSATCLPFPLFNENYPYVLEKAWVSLFSHYR